MSLAFKNLKKSSKNVNSIQKPKIKVRMKFSSLKCNKINVAHVIPIKTAETGRNNVFRSNPTRNRYGLTYSEASN